MKNVGDMRDMKKLYRKLRQFAIVTAVVALVVVAFSLISGGNKAVR